MRRTGAGDKSLWQLNTDKESIRKVDELTEDVMRLQRKKLYRTARIRQGLC